MGIFCGYITIDGIVYRAVEGDDDHYTISGSFLDAITDISEDGKAVLMQDLKGHRSTIVIFETSETLNPHGGARTLRIKCRQVYPANNHSES
jgi:hypothetical protein